MSTLLPNRISCAGLVRIVLDGKILATLNKNRLKRGVPVYTPPGGSYHLLGRSTKSYLKEHLGLVPEQGRDMRFPLQGPPEIRKHILEQFRLWFASRQGREINPARELYEELVCEDRVLCRDKHIFPPLVLLPDKPIVRHDERSSRGGHEGQVTAYFLELFEARLNRHSRAHLKRALRHNHPYARLLSLEEITCGRTEEKIRYEGYEGQIPIGSPFHHLLPISRF